ncbi:MAG: hypothetical protein Q8O40_15835 [Chloroflexota bacterium]|nr:hypothetical protein [Chloroflexota bacterium]
MAIRRPGALHKQVLDFYLKSEGWRVTAIDQRVAALELDLVAEKDSGLKEYLVVQCVDGQTVSAKDVARFAAKASAFRRQLPPIAWWDERPPVTAVLAHTGAVPPELEAQARLAEAPVQFRRF